MTRTFRSTACWFSLSKKMPLKTNRLHAPQSTKEDASLPVNVSEFEHEFRKGCIFAISTHRSRPRAARTFVTHHKAELLFLTKTKRNMFLDLDGREQKTWNISLVEFQLLFNYFIVRNFLGVAIIINYWNLCPLLFPGLLQVTLHPLHSLHPPMPPLFPLFLSFLAFSVDLDCAS